MLNPLIDYIIHLDRACNFYFLFFLLKWMLLYIIIVPSFWLYIHFLLLVGKMYSRLQKVKTEMQDKYNEQ